MAGANGVEITTLIFVIILTLCIVSVIVIVGLIFAKSLYSIWKKGLTFQAQGTISLAP